MNLDFAKFQVSTWMMFFIIIVAAISPGILLIFLFDRPLFLQLDLLRLIFLALSITLPFCAISCISLVMNDMIGMVYAEQKSGRRRLEMAVVFGCFGSTPIIYGILILKVFVNITARFAFGFALFLEICAVVAVFFSDYFYRRRERRIAKKEQENQKQADKTLNP